jgi:hypothetical protein
MKSALSTSCSRVLSTMDTESTVGFVAAISSDATAFSTASDNRTENICLRSGAGFAANRAKKAADDI